MEYRYWTYIESHPAHEPLPANAHAEALDVLTWCYTGASDCHEGKDADCAYVLLQIACSLLSEMFLQPSIFKNVRSL